MVKTDNLLSEKQLWKYESSAGSNEILRPSDQVTRQRSAAIHLSISKGELDFLRHHSKLRKSDAAAHAFQGMGRAVYFLVITFLKSGLQIAAQPGELLAKSVDQFIIELERFGFELTDPGIQVRDPLLGPFDRTWDGRHGGSFH